MLRPVLFVAALIAGTSYFASDAVASDPLHLVWKGAGVGLLAAWAATGARTRDGWLLAAAFGLYALADVVIEFGMVVGAAVFIAGHLTMIALYLRHRRELAREDWMIAGLMLVAIPVAAFLLPATSAQAIQVGLYAMVLGAMATAAWLSDFRRDRVLLGALLFVASDLLIFAQLGALRGSRVPELGIWPLYFAAQVLVVTGVAQGLAGRRR